MTVSSFDTILAIDTSTRRLVLALSFAGDRLVKSDNVVEKTHGQILIKKIDELVQSAALSKRDIKAVVVSVGPGSFTGLRIGLAAAKGLAVALDVALVGISLFELASSKMRESGQSALLVIPCRKGEYYVGRIDTDKAGDIRVLPESELPAILSGQLVFGLGFDPCSQFQTVAIDPASGPFEYDGSDLIYLGKEKLLSGEQSDLASLEPLYLQKAIAEVRFDQRQAGD